MTTKPAFFSEVWERACAEAAPDPNHAAGDLMKELAELLKVEQIEYAKLPGGALFLLDLSSLGFSQMSLNVMMVSHPPANPDQERDQAELLQQYKNAVRSVGFCFQIVLDDKLPPPNPFISSSLDAVFISGADLRRLFASDVPHGVFFEIIRRQVRLENLCPFDTTHEARGAMFRGRRTELNRLVVNLSTHFVLSGARRIGKTSLLKRAHEALWRQRDFRDRTFYFNCITWGDYLDCAHRLAHQIDPKREVRIDRSPRNLAYLLERSSSRGTKPLVLFFDEMDRVVDSDAAKGWPFFSVLAEGAGAHWIRIVFAGYRSMGHLTLGEISGHSPSASRPDTPFLGSLEPIALHPLSRGDTTDLLAEPFRSVGIPIRRGDVLLDRIWQGTSGYPFLVQFYGERLFIRATERTPTEVQLEDVEAVENSYELSDFLETHFLENTIDRGRPVASERLCAFLFAHHGVAEGWTEGDFLEYCRESGHELDLKEIHDVLRNLYNAKVLSFCGGRYSFAFPLLRRILRQSFPDLESLLNSLDRR